MEQKNFFDVFQNLKTSNQLWNIFSDVFVEKVIYDKNNDCLVVVANSKKIINHRSIEAMQSRIKALIEYVNNVKINMKFDIGDDINNCINIIYDNLLERYEYDFPLVYRMLRVANYKFDDNKLCIDINKNSYLYLTHRKIDIELKNLMKNNFGFDTQVTFNVTESEGIRANYEERRELQLKKIESAMPVSDSQPKEEFKKDAEDKNQKYKPKPRRRNGIKYNEDISTDTNDIIDSIIQDDVACIRGEIFEIELREIRDGRYLVSFDLADNTSAVTIKFFVEKEIYEEEFKSHIKKGKNLIVKGFVRYDEYARELNIMANELCEIEAVKIIEEDNEEVKRVELHLHTNMSSMDGITDIKEYVKKAEQFGHTALAVTDHGVVQAFPNAMNAVRGKDMKIIYGVEAYIIDDLEIVAKLSKNQSLNSEFVIFDLETTGLHNNTNTIIEIGAVKIKNGEVIDEFNELINPKCKLDEKIIELTKITDDMLLDKDVLNNVLPKFIKFIEGTVLVAHNAMFDVGFLNRWTKELLDIDIENTIIDTVPLCQMLFKDLKNHKLNTITTHLGIPLTNHHRAVDDAMATSKVFLKCVELLKDENINSIDELNLYAKDNMNLKKLRPNHAIILVKDEIGLRNLYELVSDAHLNNFFRRPRIVKSLYNKLNENLILGSACEAGELYKAIINNYPKKIINNIANYYDYYEIQPLGNNEYLVREGHVKDNLKLIDINIEIVNLGEKNNKLVVATGDVHFLNREDKIYRQVLMENEGFKDAHNQPPLYYRTTSDMLNEFKYLGKDKAYEVVVTNTNKISDMVNKINPVPDGTFPPEIDGANEELEKITYEKARSIYGDDLPEIVDKRLKRELGSIIGNGFAVMYIIAQKLVWKSVEDGYLVGSRGSVGSSFVATMAEITEVNPLSPHYYCKSCKYSDFDSDTVKQFAGGTGYDMPDMDCPKCGNKLSKDGHDIPFETFLGFDGDKEPDIDLNFSGEYQAKAHAYTEELFGTGYVFKAGTIGTIAETTAYGLVAKYMEKNEKKARKAEINRLRNGCVGIKRTTGQHPGGLMVVPNKYNIYDFCPIQRPANDQKSSVITTHFDYHSISGRLLKLDILGHDNPTIIKMLYDATGIDSRDVDLGDPKVMSLFTSPKELGVTCEEIDCNTGSLGLPEFGTNFVRNMLIDTQPNSFGELVRISGLSHGTDVWLNNGQELVKSGTATLKEIIPTRDDIMVLLIQYGVENLTAFKIMENVRKGKGVSEEEERIMEDANVPRWYIDSCKKIKYLFPKGHAVAYVMMTVRIAYYKIYYPYAFYYATFSVKVEDFDFSIMCQGKDRIKEEMKLIKEKGRDATAKDKSIMVLLELCLEFYARGLNFNKIDIYKSDARKFIIEEDGLLPPLSAIQGLGGNAAENIVESRKDGEFITIEDFRTRTKTNKTVIEVLKQYKILDGLPETSQLSLI